MTSLCGQKEERKKEKWRGIFHSVPQNKTGFGEGVQMKTEFSILFNFLYVHLIFLFFL